MTLAEVQRLMAAGRLDAAADSCLQILQSMPRDRTIMRLLGLIREQQKRLEEAAYLFTALAAAQPGDAQVFSDLARVRLALGDTEEALQLLSRALQLDSGDRLLLLLELAETVRQRGDLAGAEAALRQALSVEPDNPRVRCALASALAEQGELDEAEAMFASVLAEAPDDIGAWDGLGAVYMSRGDPSGALQFFNRVHSIEPCNADALYGVGAALMALNRPQEATDWLRRATTAGYGKRSEMAESLAHLALGDLPAGLRCFEARLDLAHVTPLGAGHRGLRRWRGEDLAGRTILLMGEQGLGDTVQFCRYAPMLAKRGARVVVEASVPVVTLLETLDGVAEIVHAGGALPDVDYYCPLMSLPLEFGTTLHTIPADVPYLAPTAERIAHMRGRVGDARRPRVGIAWSGNPKYANDKHRSVPLTLLEPLCAAAGSLHVLQKDVRETDRAVLSSWANVYDHSETIVDLAGTAAMASLMDVVISVDTSVAHVAGAIAHPVWLMLPFASDWRWLLNREDSPWYPTARLFRQRKLGDWEDVVERVTLALRSLPARPRR